MSSVMWAQLGATGTGGCGWEEGAAPSARHVGTAQGSPNMYGEAFDVVQACGALRAGG